MFGVRREYGRNDDDDDGDDGDDGDDDDGDDGDDGDDDDDDDGGHDDSFYYSITITAMPMAAISQVCHPSKPHTTSVRQLFH